MATLVHNIEHFLASAFNFLCNPLSPRRRLTTRIWLGAIVTFTVSTTVLMLACVCTDQWEITTFDYPLLNNSIYNTANEADHCALTETKLFGRGLLLITSGKGRSPGLLDNTTSGQSDQGAQSCRGDWQYENISLVFRQYGNAFRLCLDVDEREWADLISLCAPVDTQRCLRYSPTAVKEPFCCKQCLYSPNEVQELDENGNTTFEPIFTVIGFLIVCLVVLCACHILALIALWKRLVPVVMFTGILFFVSGTFMAFCLAAHQYKVSVMNTKRRNLPHMTYEMAISSKTELGWSVDWGWMGFALSILTGVLWIRFSFHLASETTYNKIRPSMNIIHGGSTNRAPSVAAPAGPGFTVDSVSSMTNGYGGTGMLPKTVRWAVTAGKETATTNPNSRPNSSQQIVQTEQANASNTKLNGISPQTTQKEDNVKLPMMVEDAV